MRFILHWKRLAFVFSISITYDSEMLTIRGISGPYRLFFFSFDCNEPKHIHVQRERRVCKYWMELVVLAGNHGFFAGGTQYNPPFTERQPQSYPEGLA